jgi:dihydrofolate reductase
MITSAIVACANNNVIGKDADQPFYLPADLKHFKELTVRHPVIMGRKTLASIMNRLGKPLPNRTNIVLSRTLDHDDRYLVARSLNEALNVASDHLDGTDEVFVIGGGELYRGMFDRFDRIYLTRVYAEIDGDVYFPEIKASDWTQISEEPHQADEKNHYAYSFIVLERN